MEISYKDLKKRESTADLIIVPLAIALLSVRHFGGR
jgi:hypothetical protein